MNPWHAPEPHEWWRVVDYALAEDLGSGDLSAGCVDDVKTVEWVIEAQADGIVCGLGIAQHILGPDPSDPDEVDVKIANVDGDRVRRGAIVAQGVQYAQRVFAAERTVLNFMMHLSGVATLTAAYVEKAKGTRAKIIDTRKTLPGLRTLEKYAVRCGGGFNHRMGLYDAVMLKDNHVAAAGGVVPAVRAIRSYASHMTKIEVECENPAQVQDAIDAGVDVVLLDNMDPFMMRELVQRFAGRALFEASGGVDLDTVRGVAQTGVDLVSVGALTHSAPALPFHLEFRP